jgi:aspartokinase/homoserine dehydrogenase 1
MTEDNPSKNTLVMKFGGTSVGSGEAITRAVDIIRQAKAEWQNVAVVTSAMSGVTNLLLEAANRASFGNISELDATAQSLQDKHFTAIETLIPERTTRELLMKDIEQFTASFTDLCRAMAVLGEASPRALDAAASLGERMSVRLLAAAATTVGISAQAVESMQLITTDRNFQNAYPDFEVTTIRTRQVLKPLFKGGVVPVVTGFIGATPEGRITTLGRGGSDYSAAILGAVLPANEVWIWTDVDGVMSADPRLVPEAHTLAEISYSEIAELAYYGAKVLHPKTVRPVVDAGIGLRICNTFNPSSPGTRLVQTPAGKINGKQIIKAVTAIHNQRLVTIEGRGMLGVPGVAARAFGAVASTGTSVPLITQASSEQSICFAVPAESAPSVVASLEKVFAVEIQQHDIDRVWATEDVSIITVVGAGMRHTPGVAGQIFSQLGRCEVNVLAIAQGSSEVSISLVVDAAATEPTVKALHELSAN